MEAGPLHSRLLRHGPEHMRALKTSYCSHFKAPSLPFTIRPNAKRLLVRRAVVPSAL